MRVHHFRIATMVYSLLVFLCAYAQLSAATPNANVRVVALSDGVLPGVPVNVAASQFGGPIIDGQGRVSFTASLLIGSGGTTKDNDSALWLESSPGDLRLVAREGDLAPGLNLTFNELQDYGSLIHSETGTRLFVSGLRGGPAGPILDEGVFGIWNGTGLQLLSTSRPLPGVTAPVLGPSYSVHDLNSANELTFQTGSFNTNGVIHKLFPNGTSQVIAGINNPAFVESVRLPKISDLGAVAIVVGFSAIKEGIYVTGNVSAPRLIGASDTNAPGVAGAQFSILDSNKNFIIDNKGVTFVARMKGAAITENNDMGVWTETSPGALQLLFREGQQAPGVSPDIVFSKWPHNASVVSFGNEGGISAGLGLSGPGVTASNDTAIWSGTRTTGLHLVAREGEAAPGTEPGIVFDSFLARRVMADGRGVVSAVLRGPGLDESRNRGIWAEDTNGFLRLVARRGDSVLLPDGSFGQLTAVDVGGVSGNGRIAFYGGINDARNGIFASDLVIVPEPSILLLALVAAAALSITRSGRR